MPNYHFITRWRVEASCETVYDVLGNAEGLAVWWPSVYLDVKVLEPGGPGGVNKLVELFTKGWLPYTLRWRFRVTRAERAKGFSIEAHGDFEGKGVWTFEQDGPYCNITYDWNIDAEKPLLRYFSFIMRPLFSANHHWAMRMGEISLKLELERLRKGRENVPPPPQPTFPHNFTNNKIL